MTKFYGVREFPLWLTGASALERNRLITITKSTLAGAYTTYGSVAEAVIQNDSDSDNLDLTAYLLDFVDRTFFLQIASTVAAGDLIFPSANGKGVASQHTVTNMSLASQPSPGADAKYIVPSGGWGGLHGGALAVYTHSGTSWAYTEAADAAGMVVLDTVSGSYYICNGTTWVRTKAACRAQVAGVTGNTIACSCYKKTSVVTREDLDTTINSNAKVICAGLSASETDADATVTVLNGDIAATDVALVTLKAAANAVYVTKAVCTTGTLTITLSGNGGAGTIANYMVVRPL